MGQYLPADVALERAGDLDDPRYIEGLPDDHRLRTSENVYAFSLAAASLEVLQCLSMIVAPQGIADVGEWNFHFVTGELDRTYGETCEANCLHRAALGQGDHADAPVGVHHVADAERHQRRQAGRRPRARAARAVLRATDSFARRAAGLAGI